MNTERFVKRQEEYYNLALSEIRNGRKESHYMWYIFPQLKGLGESETSEYYGIRNLQEAYEYVSCDYLKDNLIEICNVLLSLPTDNINDIFSYPDDLKLLSCMTLFERTEVSDVFGKVIDKYYNGVRDKKTLELLYTQ